MELTIKIENLTITQVKTAGLKTNTVMRDMGDYLEEVYPNDPDYSKAINALRVHKIENDIF